ncbi:hypothetical protein Pla52nx_005367 [Stieleria varia]
MHHYRVTRGEETLVTADVTMGMIDREGNLQRIPEGLIKLF